MRTHEPRSANCRAKVLFSTPTAIPPTPPLPVEVSIGNVTQLEGNAGTSTFAFPVVLNQSTDAMVTYTVGDGNAIPGVDYIPVATGTITFTAGGPQVMFVDVSVIGNVIDNQVQMGTALSGNRTFNVTLSMPQNSAIAAGFGVGVGTIVDDDALTATLSSPTVLKPQQGTASEVFTVLLSNVSPNPVTLKVSTANLTAIAPGDYTPLTNTMVTIPAGQISATFTVTVNGSTLPEGNTQFLVNVPQSTTIGVYLAQATSAGLGKPLVATVTGTIVDKDNILITMGDAAGVDGPVGTTNTLVFPVYLNAATTVPVTVQYATQDFTATSMGATPIMFPQLAC